MNLDRRRLVAGAAAFGGLGLASCATTRAAIPDPRAFYGPRLAPIRAEIERMTRMTVCLRPFRRAGPRLEVETVGDKRVVHNYGHGGSGWSLSWGSGEIAARYALEGGERDVAVIGCGALGLTAATVLQQAGANVTIYAKERMFEARSSRATGVWSPDSRIADANVMPAGFAEQWEAMARTSWRMFHTYLGLAGAPVEWADRYGLAGGPESAPLPVAPGSPQIEPVQFAHLSSRIRDLQGRSRLLAAGSHPFPVARATRGSQLQFNIAAYARLLATDFLLAGGKIETRTFNSPSELSDLSQQVIVNCTGYGARALFKDESIVPVRGQIAWLIPQDEVHYNLFYRDVAVVSRHDGMMVQYLGPSEMFGYADDNEVVDRAESEAAVNIVAELYERFPANLREQA